MRLAKINSAGRFRPVGCFVTRWGRVNNDPAKVFGKRGSADAPGYGGTRWGREPCFKKVFSPQNSFAPPFFLAKKVLLICPSGQKIGCKNFYASICSAWFMRFIASGLPKTVMISPGPPGVTAQPDTAMRNAHMGKPSFISLVWA